MKRKSQMRFIKCCGFALVICSSTQPTFSDENVESASAEKNARVQTAVRIPANQIETSDLAKETAPPPVYPSTRAGSAFTDCRDCPEMVVIGPGNFIMGSTEEERRTLGVISMFDTMEEPRHKVSIEYSFALSRYEVTFEQWDACVADGGCNGYRPDDEGWGRGQQPVINVNFNDAQNYVTWLSEKTGEHYRLPSEAEWAYAARGGTQTWYPFGNRLTADDANAGYVLDRTARVGSYAPNGFGLHDVTGNVAEWTIDCYHENYEGAPTDGSAWLTGSCESRNVRGGGWSLLAWSVRVAQRIGDPPDARNSHLGLRIARDLPPAQD